MTQTIDQALVTQFSNEVVTLAQQTQSYFRGNVAEIMVSGNDYAVERLDRVQAIEVTTRHADTVGQDITHTRRQLKMREFRSTIYLDDFDALQTLIDPQREYAKAVSAALMRNFDKVVADAAFADVQTGRTFGTAVTFANDDGITIATGSTGATYDKLLEVKQNFIDNGVGMEFGEELIFAATGQQHTNMMKEEELTSGDFRRDYVVEGGSITKALGMKCLFFPGLQNPAIISKSSTTRSCIAFAKSGLAAGMNKDLQISIDKRPDKNNMIQVQSCMYIGAVRRDGFKVQKVQCTEV